jgi:hypothetical protein
MTMAFDPVTAPLSDRLRYFGFSPQFVHDDLDLGQTFNHHFGYLGFDNSGFSHFALTAGLIFGTTALAAAIKSSRVTDIASLSYPVVLLLDYRVVISHARERPRTDRSEMLSKQVYLRKFRRSSLPINVHALADVDWSKSRAMWARAPTHRGDRFRWFRESALIDVATTRRKEIEREACAWRTNPPASNTPVFRLWQRVRESGFSEDSWRFENWA